MDFFKRIKESYNSRFIEPLNELKFLQAKILIENIKNKGKLTNIQKAEFKIFSQFGDDGIIQYIVNRLNLPPGHQTFIEFGVADYSESNTKFLLMNNNWSGLVMDSSEDNINRILKDSIYWKYSLKAIAKFITRDNINSIITKEGFAGEVGLLHIDIDGNDYWVWESINVTRPIVLILEYNSVFGIDKAITVPYKSDFYRTKAHYSNLYWGASLKALYRLSIKKGYTFIGSNSTGINAYFIRNDYSKFFNRVSLKDGYVESKYRESRDVAGNLTYLSGGDRLRAIRKLSVIDLTKNQKMSLSELI